jgi:hypothetical protein
MIEERISKQQIEQLYGVNRLTIESWVKHHGFPMITINSHSKYVTKSSLLTWEQNKMKNKIELEHNESE